MHALASVQLALLDLWMQHPHLLVFDALDSCSPQHFQTVCWCDAHSRIDARGGGLPPPGGAYCSCCTDHQLAAHHPTLLILHVVCTSGAVAGLACMHTSCRHTLRVLSGCVSRPAGMQVCSNFCSMVCELLLTCILTGAHLAAPSDAWVVLCC